MARGNLKKCGYMPLFPATSPYVTAVGGTQVNNAMTVGRRSATINMQ